MQLDLRDIEVVHAIEKHRGITAAAAELHITQPALSIYLNRLEDRLGLRIFDRIGKTFRITYAGRCILEDGLQILLLEKGIEERLMSIRDYREGLIRIGVPIMRGLSVLPPLIAEFHGSYPNIRVEIEEEDFGVLLEKQLLSGDIDLAFFNLIEPTPQLDYILLRQESMVLFAPEDFPEGKNARVRTGFPYPWIDLGACADYPFIMTAPMQISTTLSERIFRDYQMEPRIILKLRNQLTAIAMTVRSGALFLAPDYFRFPDFFRQHPRVYSVGKDVPYEISFVAATRKNYPVSAPIRRLLEIITAQTRRQYSEE